jgi:hypothetical protein
MIVLKEEIAYSILNPREVCLYPGIFVKNLFVPCKTFSREQDRYGRDRLRIYFPIDAKLSMGKKGAVLLPSDDHTTILVWSKGILTLTSSKGVRVFSTPDDNPGFYNNILSARKGRKVIARDEYEEMTLVF